MSKHIGCIVNELEKSELVGDDFGLFVIVLSMDDTGEVIATESIEPIGKIGVNIENEECLFHISSSEEPLKVSEAYAELATIDAGFSLVSSVEQEIDDSWVRIDNPVIGFGKT